MIVEKLIQLLDRSEHLVLVSKQTKSNWKAGTNRPKLHTVVKIIEVNNYDIFISDGNIDDLIEFNKKFAEKKGLKMNLIFEI